MEWEKNCNETWVGNMHAWETASPNPLPLWKRLIGYQLKRCAKCGKTYETPWDGEWSG